MSTLGVVTRAVLATAGLLGGVVGALFRWEWQRRRGRGAFRRALRAAGLPEDAARQLTADYQDALSLRAVVAAARGRARPARR